MRFDTKRQKYYYARLMSASAGFDSLEFAFAGQVLRGSLPVAGLKRLEDVLFDSEGSFDYELRGGRDERGRARLEIRIHGPLHLQCQRCLQLLDYRVDVANTVLVVPRGAEVDENVDDPNAPDAIEASAELDVAGLIEDEVLLSLPLAPRHPEGTCTSRIGAHSGREIGVQAAFSQLAALKRPRNKH